MVDRMIRKGPLTGRTHGTKALSSKKSLPKFSHLFVPACHACRGLNRVCVITASTGSRVRSCDHCRSWHIKCVSDETEGSRSSASVGKKRRHANYGVLSELKKKKAQTRKQPDGTRRASKKGKEKVFEDADGRDISGVVDVVRSTRLERSLKELTMNTAALTEAITRNMAAIAEERRGRAECDHRTTEMMNLMLKVMHKIVDTGSISSASRRA